MSRSKSAYGIALYGYNINEYPYENWLNFVIQYMAKIGCPVTHFSIDGDDLDEEICGLNLSLENNKGIAFESTHQKLLGFTLTSCNDETENINQSWLTFNGNLFYSDYQSLFFLFDEVFLNKINIVNLIYHISNFGDIIYGYFFKKEYNDYPELYISGATSKNIYLNALESEWNHVGLGEPQLMKVYLRNVFFYNILNNFHLDLLIDGMSLENWIKHNSVGKISNLSNGLWLWEVSQNQISDVRLYLGSKLLIIEDPRFPVKSLIYNDFMSEHNLTTDSMMQRIY